MKTQNLNIRLIIAAIAIAIGASCANAASFADESLNYKVLYKWGLVQKQAGTVKFTLKNKGNECNARLTARTDPWADHFYKVRDTLNATFTPEPFRPSFYEKISNEGGDYKHDIVRYSRRGATTIGDCTRLVINKKGQQTTDDKRTLESMGTTVDMLSVFYYMRSLPFEKWTKNQVTSINIFSGKRQELLTIKFLGIETVKYDKKEYNCFRINFKFTSNSGKTTSDDIDAWITTGPQRIPVKLEGKLPIGKIQCFYTH